MQDDFFDETRWAERLRELEARGNAPEWLLAAMRRLGEVADQFPPIEDEARFVNEFIYPH